MTAEELFEDYKEYTALSEGHFDYLINNEDFKKALIEFAKYHVEKALEEANNKADAYVIGGLVAKIDEDSILNAYPLENIK